MPEQRKARKKRRRKKNSSIDIRLFFSFLFFILRDVSTDAGMLWSLLNGFIFLNEPLHQHAHIFGPRTSESQQADQQVATFAAFDPLLNRAVSRDSLS